MYTNKVICYAVLHTVLLLEVIEDFNWAQRALKAEDTGFESAENVKKLIEDAHNLGVPIAPLIPNDETIAAMEDVRHGRVTSVASVESLFEALDDEPEI